LRVSQRTNCPFFSKNQIIGHQSSWKA